MKRIALTAALALLSPALAQTTLKVLFVTAPSNMDAINAQFQKENPNIKLDFQVTPDPQYGDVIRARLAGGDAPDVFEGHARQEMQTWQKAGLIADLSREPWVARLAPASLKLAQIDNKVYQFPLGGDGLGLMYNRDLLARAGASVPTSYPQFVTALDKLQKAGIRPFLAGFKDNFSSLIWSSMIASNTIYRTDPSQDARLIAGRSSFDSPQWQGVLKQMTDLGKYYDIRTALGIGGYDQVKNEFVAGRVAFIPYGSWAIAEMKKAAPNLKFGFIPYPGNPAGSKPVATTIANAAVMVSAKSKNADAARRYVAFLARPDIYRQYIGAAGLFSSQKTVPSDVADEATAFASTVAAGRSATFFVQTWPGNHQENWQKMLGNYFANNLTPSQALKTFDAQFRAEVKKQ